MKDPFFNCPSDTAASKPTTGHDILPLAADAWVTSSLLQKAIRRGETGIAQQAALRFHYLRGSAIWRRFMVIAFEDVGVASVDALVAVTACRDPTFRNKHGSDERVLAGLARLLAEAAKCRSSDYLICAAKKLAALEHVREMAGGSKPGLRLEMVADKCLPLTTRAIVAWYSSGIEWGDENRVGKGDLPGLLKTFRNLGVPEPLADATQVAAHRTRQPMCVMVPLIWLVAFDGQQPPVIECPVPPAPVVNGVPLYAFDKHTRIGKAAIRTLARENDAVRQCLETYVPGFRTVKALEMACYYTDAAPISRRLDWNGSAELERLGTAADMDAVGVPPEGIDPLLQVVCDNLDHLNLIRARLLTGSRS